MASSVSVKLAYSSVDPDGGASSGRPPIIFCHAMTASKENWGTIPQSVANATKRKVYAIDARNHGDSGWTDTFDFEVNVNDLLYFMDTIGTKTATIVGHGMGGATAMRAALRAPDRITSFVVEDLGVSRFPAVVYELIRKKFSIGRAVLEQMTPWTDEDEMKDVIFETLLKTMPAEMHTTIKRDSLDHTIIQLKRLPDGRLTHKCNAPLIEEMMNKPDILIPEIKGLYQGPACFIYGKLSSFNVLQDEQNVKKIFPNAELIGIEDSTHNVHAERREEFVAALFQFLSK